MSRSDLPPLNWLRAFEAASRHLSFTGAAVELGMTQSAVSQQIKSLEGFLGMTLFHRRPRVLEITEAGHNYLPSVQDAFTGLATATRNLRGTDRDEVLQVQSNLSFSVFWLGPRLPRLFEKYPWLRIIVSTALWEPERMASGADIEIRYASTVPNGAVDLLSNDVCYPVCAPNMDVTKDNLFDHYFYDCNGLTANWENWCKLKGIQMPADKRITYATTLTVSTHAAERGAGISLGHDVLVRDLVREGRLKRPFEGALEMQEAYYLITPERSKARAQSAFRDWIMAEIKHENKNRPNRAD